MKLNLKQSSETGEAESLLSSAIIVILLLLLPSFGGSAMLAGSAVALAVWATLFPRSFRTRHGSLAVAICVLLGMALAAVITIGISLYQKRLF